MRSHRISTQTVVDRKKSSKTLLDVVTLKKKFYLLIREMTLWRWCKRIINVCVLTLFKVMEIYEIYTKARLFAWPPKVLRRRKSTMHQHKSTAERNLCRLCEKFLSGSSGSQVIFFSVESTQRFGISSLLCFLLLGKILLEKSHRAVF